MGADAALEGVRVGGLRGVVEELVEGHGFGAEGVEVVLVVAEGESDGLHNALGQGRDLLHVVHAGVAEVRSEAGGPDVGPVGKSLGEHGWVGWGEVRGYIIAFFEVGLSVFFNHLAVHDFVAAVMLVLGCEALVSCKVVEGERGGGSADTFVEFHLLLFGESEESFGELEHLLLEA